MKAGKINVPNMALLNNGEEEGEMVLTKLNRKGRL